MTLSKGLCLLRNPPLLSRLDLSVISVAQNVCLAIPLL